MKRMLLATILILTAVPVLAQTADDNAPRLGETRREYEARISGDSGKLADLRRQQAEEEKIAAETEWAKQRAQAWHNIEVNSRRLNNEIRQRQDSARFCQEESNNCGRGGSSNECAGLHGLEARLCQQGQRIRGF